MIAFRLRIDYTLNILSASVKSKTMMRHLPKYRTVLVMWGCLIGWTNLPVLAIPAKTVDQAADRPALPAARSAVEAEKIIDEVWQIVNREYIDSSFNQQDWPALRKQLLARPYQTKQEVYTALQTALKSLNDRYTRFMDPAQFAALSSGGEVAGIGIRLDIAPNSKYINIVEPLPDSPASKAGIQPGDMLLQVNGRSTQGQSVEDVAGLLRGKAGERVTLLIQRGNTEQTLRITRANIRIQVVRHAAVETPIGRIGYIRINEFANRSAIESKVAIETLEKAGVTAYVLDLRGNPGGLFKDGIDVTRQWLHQGDIMTMKSRDKVETTSAQQTALSPKPLVIMVDGKTAAASEILAAALQENGRAQLVGTTTFGQNVIGSVHALKSDGSGVVVMIAKWLTPKRHDISGKGITPDVLIELSPAQRTELSKTPKMIGTVADPQFAKALSVLERQIKSPPVPPKSEQVPPK
jgi:carboxyl-terminal processing protease